MLPIIGGLISTLSGGLDKLITSDEERLKVQVELDKLRNDLGKALLEHEKTLIQAQKSILEKEINSGSWIARNWRPSLMLVFTVIIAYNFLFLPLAEFVVTTFHINAWIPLREDLPENVWDLLKIGLGGYIVGRSAEKVAGSLKK